MVAVMSVVWGVSATATVEEMSTAAAEEVDDGQGGWRLCSLIYFKKLFIHKLFLEPACDGQHGNQVPSVNSSFIDTLICEPLLNSN
jgi:hypothetical protein